MSNVFKNTLKSFKSDITGEELEYRVNNAVWIYLEELFDLTQGSFDKELQTNSNAAMAKFTTAVLKANGLDVSYEEVMANTDPKGVIKFYNDFFDIAFGVEEEMGEKIKQAEEKRAEREKNSK